MAEVREQAKRHARFGLIAVWIYLFGQLAYLILFIALDR